MLSRKKENIVYSVREVALFYGEPLRRILTLARRGYFGPTTTIPSKRTGNPVDDIYVAVPAGRVLPRKLPEVAR